MIHIQGKIPNTVYLAISGGVDSMAILSFLLQGKKNVTLLYYNHNTPYGNICQTFLEDYSKEHSLKLFSDKLLTTKSKNTSQEDFWRINRYNFLNQFQDAPVITCHHLDDVIETYIFTSLRGNSKLIPYSRDNFIRPFLLTRKQELIKWAQNHKTPWKDDPTNIETHHSRNYIRHNIVHHALHINPGLYKTISKKLIEQSQK
jgi:tRNA(Ile)-lysidine synthase